MNPSSTVQDTSGKQPVQEDPIKCAWEDVVINGRPPRVPVRPIIVKSWIRCRKAKIDPYADPPPPIISQKELARLRAENRDLIVISRPVMEMIEISVQGTGFMVTLADRLARILETMGDRKILEVASWRKYIPGCMRDTKYSGTNAIALALEEVKPVQLTGAEHYNIHYHFWTCSSAPIRDAKGRVIGLITLSGRSIGRHQHTLALVTAAAEIIEAQFRERTLIKEDQRLNTMLARIYNSLTDGFIAVDNTLEITHLNNKAVKMLGIENPEAIVGHRLDEVALLDRNLIETLENREPFNLGKIRFKTPGGFKTYMCRMDLIQTSSYKLMGMVLTMSEKRQMFDKVRKISGNYAKYEFSDIKGETPELKRQIELAKIAARTSSRVMLVGESGTGKELFAQAIHSHSNRRNEPFVAISCAAIPRDLIESELFGYIGGAFTGARQKGMVGKFELAHRGTLFLDEINGMPLELQGKLLRVLQQNEIMRLGGSRPIPVDVRVIAASNRDLLNDVENGNFREDLYYRLNVVEIFIPPLRSHKSDIELLASHIIARLSREMCIPRPEITSEAMDKLMSYDWPGNVRELENICERALLLSQGQTIDVFHLPLRQRQRTEATAAGTMSLRQSYQETMEATIAQCGGNVSNASRVLKIARSTLYRKMKEFGIPKRPPPP
jgi:transcriptional regulator of acetoin/glycerol metabolism